MKTLNLAIITVTILLIVPVVMNNQVKAICVPNPDWPQAPCYGDPSYHPSKEKQQEDWSPYYQYKGAAWMEMMKVQLINAMRNGTLEDWVNYDQAHYNSWRYYYLNDQAPFFRSSVSGLNDEHPYFPPPIQQLTTGIEPMDVACKKGLNLVLKAEDGSPACIHESSMARMLRQGWYAWYDKVGDTIVNTPDKLPFGGKDCAIPQPAYSIIGSSGFAKDDLPNNGVIYPGTNLTKNLVGNVIQFALQPNSTAYIHFTYDFNHYPGSNCRVTTEDAISSFNGNKSTPISELLGSPYANEVNQTKIRTDVPYQKDKSNVKIFLSGVQEMNDHVVRVSYKLVTDPNATLGKSYYIGFWFRSGILVTIGDNLYNGTAFQGGFS
ncbi:MAG: hypothetical protein KGI27_06155 [Thaumarchaeota archaeon]|nr:hypothetical protein [Nitrososphaerota archaeon]